MRVALLALSCLALLPWATLRAQGLASARPLVVIDDPVLRLGDVFEGADQRRVGIALGASPAPGRRLVLEAAQLVALARAHGLAWRPLSPHERVVVERPGRAVPREEIEAALRADLLRLGLDPEAELDLPGLLSPMVPPSAPVRLEAEGTTFDATTGRFAATLVAVAEGSPTLRLRVAGRAAPTMPAVVATRRLALGEVVGPGDVRLVRLRAERGRPGVAQGLDQVVGRQLRRPIGAEQPFALADLAAPALVERNALVTLVLDAEGMQITAQGRALEAAPRGAVVPVMNLSSRTVVEGRVVAPGRVRVAVGGGAQAPLR